jgi:hypothetical protein
MNRGERKTRFFELGLEIGIGQAAHNFRDLRCGQTIMTPRLV